MDARDRFITALAELVNSTYYAQGFLYISAQDVEALARTHAVPDAEARAALRSLDDQGLLLRQEGGHSYSDGLGLALTHEESDRALFWRRNLLRREILRLAADAFDEGSNGLDWDEGDDHLIDTPWSEKFMAVQILAYLGLMEVRHASGTTLWAFITSTGYDLQREGRELARQLPTSAAEDETAGALVAPDALRDLILSVEDLLTKRNWHGAARELGRGDEQYRDGHWTDTVREYYAALESALKHRLDEAGAPHGEGAALKQLAGQAADNELVPVNYKAMFGFADSIRSPRSHGAGAKPSEVEVGRAEALLMSNHVRGLILYLGHRPR